MSEEGGPLIRPMSAQDKAIIVDLWNAGKPARVKMSDEATRVGGDLAKVSARFVHEAKALYVFLPEWQGGRYDSAAIAGYIGSLLALAADQQEAAKGDPRASAMAQGVVDGIRPIAQAFIDRGYTIERDLSLRLPAWAMWAIAGGTAWWLWRSTRAASF